MELYAPDNNKNGRLSLGFECRSNLPERAVLPGILDKVVAEDFFLFVCRRITTCVVLLTVRLIHQRLQLLSFETLVLQLPRRW